MEDSFRHLPSAIMGEYCIGSHEKKIGLFPLEGEGLYGDVPPRRRAGRWHQPETYIRRVKKPKVYSSYAINSTCELHSPSSNYSASQPIRRESTSNGRMTTPSRESTPSSMLSFGPSDSRNSTPASSMSIGLNYSRESINSIIPTLECPLHRSKYPQKKDITKQNKDKTDAHNGQSQYYKQDLGNTLNMVSQIQLLREIEKESLERLKDFKEDFSGESNQETYMKDSLNPLKRTDDKNEIMTYNVIKEENEEDMKTVNNKVSRIRIQEIEDIPIEQLANNLEYDIKGNTLYNIDADILHSKQEENCQDKKRTYNIDYLHLIEKDENESEMAAAIDITNSRKKNLLNPCLELHLVEYKMEPSKEH